MCPNIWLVVYVKLFFYVWANTINKTLQTTQPLGTDKKHEKMRKNSLAQLWFIHTSVKRNNIIWQDANMYLCLNCECQCWECSTCLMSCKNTPMNLVGWLLLHNFPLSSHIWLPIRHKTIYEETVRFVSETDEQTERGWWSEKTGSTAKGVKAISHWIIPRAISSKECITILGCQAGMDKQDTYSGRPPFCVCKNVCAQQKTLNKNGILIWNLTERVQGLLSCTLKNTWVVR